MLLIARNVNSKGREESGQQRRRGDVETVILCSLLRSIGARRTQYIDGHYVKAEHFTRFLAHAETTLGNAANNFELLPKPLGSLDPVITE